MVGRGNPFSFSACSVPARGGGGIVGGGRGGSGGAGRFGHAFGDRHGERPAWAGVPFAAAVKEFSVSKVAPGGSKVETCERLLELFTEAAKAYSYDVAAN